MVEIHKNGKPDKEHSLKGTFAGVMLLGAFLTAVWLGVFVIFLQRG